MIMLLMSCSDRPKNTLIGHWNVHHVVINGKDITNNNYHDNNAFDQNLTKTKNLIIQYDSLYLQLDREQKRPFSASLKLSRNNRVIIQSVKYPVLNSTYKINVDTAITFFDNIKTYDIRVSLKSVRKQIYISRYEVVDKRHSWLNKIR